MAGSQKNGFASGSGVGLWLVAAGNGVVAAAAAVVVAPGAVLVAGCTRVGVGRGRTMLAWSTHPGSEASRLLRWPRFVVQSS